MRLAAQLPSSSSSRGQEVSSVIERRKLCCEMIDLHSQAAIWPRKICTWKAVSPVESLGGVGTDCILLHTFTIAAVLQQAPARP
jgi:hypothetical protein